MKRFLVGRGVRGEELDALSERTQSAVLAAVERARQGARADPSTVMQFVYRSPAFAAIPG
jgi:TPP-dependent pyruvate/acetoin dehydrogenase alpha subunit